MDITRASKLLLLKEPYYGLYFLSLDRRENSQIATACVSRKGIDVKLDINPKFWEEIYSPKDELSQVAVLKHEMLHICLGHLSMLESFPDHKLRNIAADLEVNQYIEEKYKGENWKKIGTIEFINYPELNLKPKGGIKYYYEELSKVLQNRQKMGLSQPQNQGQPQQDQQGQDQNQQGQPQQGQGQGQNQPQQSSGQGNNKGGGKKGSSPETSSIWDYYDKSGGYNSHELWKEFMDGLSDAEKRLIQNQIEHQMKKMAEETQRMRGTIPSELKEFIDRLFEVEAPVIDWKQYLRRFAGNSNKTYTKKSRHKINKRFVDNPALKIKLKKHILVGRDTSGSTSEQDHIEFFNELHHMYKAGIKITVADSDAGVHDVFEYKGKPPAQLTGRGGTDFDPVIEFYNKNYKKYDALIYLTDGYCTPPNVKPRTTMLWVISSNGAKLTDCPFPGKVVKIDR